MKLEKASAQLAALGSPIRLRIYRLLVKAGTDGLTVGAVQDKVGLVASTPNIIFVRNDFPAKDLQEFIARAKEMKASFVDRLTLNEARLEAMAKGLEEIAALPDPVGQVMAKWTRPNGLEISRVRVPIGVIGIIYESRPNVTADAGGLCLKSGNAAILRGGSDSFHTSAAIIACLQRGLDIAGLPRTAIQMVPNAERDCVGLMLEGLGGTLDLIVPRGGKSLVARVQADARVPVFSHLEGICHVYVDKAADTEMARKIVLNAKMRRTGICGAAETILIDRAGAERNLKPIISTLIDAGCEVRGDAEAQQADARVKPATEQDWSTEYLDAIVSMKLVGGVDEAMLKKEYGARLARPCASTVLIQPIGRGVTSEGNSVGRMASGIVASKNMKLDLAGIRNGTRSCWRCADRRLAGSAGRGGSGTSACGPSPRGAAAGPWLRRWARRAGPGPSRPSRRPCPPGPRTAAPADPWSRCFRRRCAR